MRSCTPARAMNQWLPPDTHTLYHQPLTVNSLSRGPPPSMLHCLTGLWRSCAYNCSHCKFIHVCNGHAMSGRQYLTALPILWLLHSFCLFLYTVRWALEKQVDSENTFEWVFNDFMTLEIWPGCIRKKHPLLPVVWELNHLGQHTWASFYPDTELSE